MFCVLPRRRFDAPTLNANPNQPGLGAQSAIIDREPSNCSTAFLLFAMLVVVSGSVSVRTCLARFLKLKYASPAALCVEARSDGPIATLNVVSSPATVAGQKALAARSRSNAIAAARKARIAASPTSVVCSLPHCVFHAFRPPGPGSSAHLVGGLLDETVPRGLKSPPPTGRATAERPTTTIVLSAEPFLPTPDQQAADLSFDFEREPPPDDEPAARCQAILEDPASPDWEVEAGRAQIGALKTQQSKGEPA